MYIFLHLSGYHATFVQLLQSYDLVTQSYNLAAQLYKCGIKSPVVQYMHELLNTSPQPKISSLPSYKIIWCHECRTMNSWHTHHPLLLHYSCEMMADALVSSVFLTIETVDQRQVSLKLTFVYHTHTHLTELIHEMQLGQVHTEWVMATIIKI